MLACPKIAGAKADFSSCLQHLCRQSHVTKNSIHYIRGLYIIPVRTCSGTARDHGFTRTK
jgi:hypothetical protein